MSSPFLCHEGRHSLAAGANILARRLAAARAEDAGEVLDIDLPRAFRPSIMCRRDGGPPLAVRGGLRATSRQSPLCKLRGRRQGDQGRAEHQFAHCTPPFSPGTSGRFTGWLHGALLGKALTGNVCPRLQSGPRQAALGSGRWIFRDYRCRRYESKGADYRSNEYKFAHCVPPLRCGPSM